MRYCAHCGRVIDEYDLHRNSFNCHVCDAILLEDDMTALKYAELSEDEKDEYDNQLLDIIKHSIGFDESLFEQYCSVDTGDFYRCFRPDKYLQMHTFKKEEYRINYLTFRKANEPFKPFPPIDKEKARAYTHSSVEEQKRLEQSLQQRNVPKCPTCGSTNISKIGTLNRIASVGFFGLASSKIGKTQKCNNCGYTW
jgi:hypothetical protein